MLLTILISTTHADTIQKLVDNINNTAHNPSDIRLVLLVDESDYNTQKAITKCIKHHLSVSDYHIPADDGYWTLWKYHNQWYQINKGSSKLYLSTNDRLRFLVKDWDIQLQSAINEVPKDEIYHLRLTSRRTRRFERFDECLPYGESLPAVSERWAEIAGGTCIGRGGTDTGNECVTWFLRRMGHERGIPIEIKVNEDILVSSNGTLPPAIREKKHEKVLDLYADLLKMPYVQLCYEIAARIAREIDGITRPPLNDAIYQIYQMIRI